MYAGAEVTIIIECCYFDNNDATDKGGGVYAQYADVFITDCDLIGNYIEGLGGGVARIGAEHPRPVAFGLDAHDLPEVGVRCIEACPMRLGNIG